MFLCWILFESRADERWMAWRVDGSAAKLQADATNLLWNTWLRNAASYQRSTLTERDKPFQSWRVAVCVAFDDFVSIHKMCIYVQKNELKVKKD